jgi:trigger factor
MDALLSSIDIPLPEGLVSREIENRQQALADRLERSGNTMDEYLEAANLTAAELEDQFAEDARRSVKAGFVLDKLATQEELGVDQAELAGYLTEQAYRMGVSPDRLAKELSDRGQLGSVAADVLRGKALRLLAERATVTDESGRPVDVKAAVREAAGEDGDDAAEGDADAAESGADAETGAGGGGEGGGPGGEGGRGGEGGGD